MIVMSVATVVSQIPDPVRQVSLSAASAILAGLKLDDNIVYQILRRDIMEESSVYRSIIAEGAAKTKREIALNFLRDGLSIEAVARGTQLSIEEVQLLQQELSTPSAA